MSTTIITPRTTAEQLAYARRVLAEAETAPPFPSVQGQAAVDWARSSLAESLALYGRIETGEACWSECRAPDMGWWENPLAEALEFQADDAWQCAIALEKRMAEARAEGKQAKRAAA